MLAISLFTGQTQPTTQNPYRAGTPAATYPPNEIPLYPTASPASPSPASVASDPYATAAPLASTSPVSQPVPTTQPVGVSPAPSAQRPWWEQARTDLANTLLPSSGLPPTPEPRDPYTKPEMPTPAQAGFTPTTQADWEMQDASGQWVPYTYDVRPNMAQGGYIGEPSLNPNTWEWSEPEVIAYDPGYEFNVVPSSVVGGYTTYLPQVKVRRRSGAPGTTQPATGTSGMQTTGTSAAPADTAQPTNTTQAPAATTPTDQTGQPVTFAGYLNDPTAVGSNATTTTQPTTTATNTTAPTPSQAQPVTPASSPAAPTYEPSTYRQSSAPAASERTTYTQDYSAPASGGRWDRYVQSGGDTRVEDDGILDDPIFARYFQVLSRQHGRDKAREMIRGMARRGNSPRGPRSVNLIPGQDGFLENLTKR